MAIIKIGFKLGSKNVWVLLFARPKKKTIIKTGSPRGFSRVAATHTTTPNPNKKTVLVLRVSRIEVAFGTLFAVVRS